MSSENKLNIWPFWEATYSKTLLSFWSPQMSISAIDLSVSTKSPRLFSDTIWFFAKTLYRYLWTAFWITCHVNYYTAFHVIRWNCIIYSLQMFQRMWIFGFPQSTTKPTSTSKHDCLFTSTVTKLKVILIPH